jgi:5-methylcytosine-specific restriction endonuclease McrA
MKFELKPYIKSVSQNEIIDDFQKVAGELGKKSVTQKEYVKHGKYSVKTIYNKFNSWKEVLGAANLKLSSNTGSVITDEELFADLKNIWTKLGRQPNYNEMIKPLSKYHACTYERRFKGWRKALERFVIYINNEENVSSKEGIKNLEVKPTTKHKTSRNINWRLRFIVMRHDNFKCKGCGRSPATDPSIILHVDHIKAWSNGGETILENLQTLCSKCNIGKSNLR